MFFKNIQTGNNPFFKTLNLDSHGGLSFSHFFTKTRDIKSNGRLPEELFTDTILNGLSAEIKKAVLAPTYRKSSDGKWVNPEEMTLMLKRVRELGKASSPR